MAVPGTPINTSVQLLRTNTAPASTYRARHLSSLPRVNRLFPCPGQLAEPPPPASTPSLVPSFARRTPPHQGIHSRSEFVRQWPAVPGTRHGYGAFTGLRDRAPGPKLLTPSPATAHHRGFPNRQTPTKTAQAARPDGAPRLCACVRARAPRVAGATACLARPNKATFGTSACAAGRTRTLPTPRAMNAD